MVIISIWLFIQNNLFPSIISANKADISFKEDK